MKFIVSRVSHGFRDDEPPIDGAYKDKYYAVDARTVDSPEKLISNIYMRVRTESKESWYSKGSNHRLENGMIKRDILTDGWFINLDTLEDLLKVKKFVKEKIVICGWDGDGIDEYKYLDGTPIYEIEIYDDYRE